MKLTYPLNIGLPNRNFHLSTIHFQGLESRLQIILLFHFARFEPQWFSPQSPKYVQQKKTNISKCLQPHFSIIATTCILVHSRGFFFGGVPSLKLTWHRPRKCSTPWKFGDSGIWKPPTFSGGYVKLLVSGRGMTGWLQHSNIPLLFPNL